MDIKIKLWVRSLSCIAFSLLLAVIVINTLPGGHAQSSSSITSSSFNYGYDFTDAEPDAPTKSNGNDPAAVASALTVMSKFSGSLMDQSIYGFGAGHDPEGNPVQAPGSMPGVSNTDLTSITPRINLITGAGGVPVITLVQAPSWMYQPQNCPDGVAGSINGNLDTNINTPGVTAFVLPPCPDNYQNFANLCAYIAETFPQVKYFVVWSEVRDFYNPASKTYDAANYTRMYNDVYTAIKAVRPDALVGGPYASMSAYTTEQPHSDSSTLHGSWGWIDADMQNVLSYWLANKVGADFVAVDGKTEIASDDSDVTDPLTASEKYAAVDTWIRSQSNLPIWWMESHIAPGVPVTGGSNLTCVLEESPTPAGCWDDSIGAAARIATLALMNASGANVGLQWQPQAQTSWPDEGLWTSTVVSGGGQPTILANDLESVLPLLEQPLTLLANQPTGVLAATEGNQLLLANTNSATATASVNSNSISLAPGAVIAEAMPSTPTTPGKTTTPPTNPGQGGTSNSTSSTKSATSTSLNTTKSSSIVAGASASDPITGSTITLIPPASDVGKIKSVTYAIDNKVVDRTSTSPYTYKFKTDSLANGCHELTTTTYLINGTSTVSNQRLCVKTAAVIWYNTAVMKIVSTVALIVSATFVLWELLGYKRIVELIHHSPFGHHLTHVAKPLVLANDTPGQVTGLLPGLVIHPSIENDNRPENSIYK